MPARPPARHPSRSTEALALGVLIRALLTSVSVITMLPVTIALTGGLFPRLPGIGPFGAVLNTGLPWVLGAAAVAAGLAGTAVALGGRKALVLFVGCLVALGGSLFIGFRYVTFADDNGATYDIIQAADGFPPIPELDQQVVFATVEGTDLHAGLWLPSGAGTAARGSMPAVVFVHGGAFQGGGLGTRPTLLGALRSAGIVAIDVEYRLSPPPRWDQAPGDVLCALAWLPTAPELAMVDPRRVVIVGESAGGSLAMVAGYAAGTDVISSSCPDVGAPLVPVGVWAIAPTADLEGIWQDASIRDFSGGRFPEAYIGGTPAQFPDRYAAAEPFRLLRADLPPTVILQGETDHFVHLERSVSVADRIRAAGAQVELLIAPFAGHGFDGEPNSFGAQFSEIAVPAFVHRVAG